MSAWRLWPTSRSCCGGPSAFSLHESKWNAGQSDWDQRIDSASRGYRSPPLYPEKLLCFPWLAEWWHVVPLGVFDASDWIRAQSAPVDPCIHPVASISHTVSNECKRDSSIGRHRWFTRSFLLSPCVRERRWRTASDWCLLVKHVSFTQEYYIYMIFFGLILYLPTYTLTSKYVLKCIHLPHNVFNIDLKPTQFKAETWYIYAECMILFGLYNFIGKWRSSHFSTSRNRPSIFRITDLFRAKKNAK